MGDDVAGMLHGFEAELRGFVQDALISEGDGGWSKCIPAEVKKRAECLFQRQTACGKEVGSMMECLEFSDYQKIIDHNWDAVFKNIFIDHDLLRVRFQELAVIRNKIAHSRGVREEDCRGFEYHTAKIKRAFLAGGTDHTATAHYLESYGKPLKHAYEGAVRAIHQDAYPDQTVQFAHSLREVIDLLAQADPSAKGKRYWKNGERGAAIKKAVDPYGGRSLSDDCEMLDAQYQRLSKIAHHRETITVSDGLGILKQVCHALARLTRPQQDVTEEVDRMMGEEPTAAKAERLRVLLEKEVTRIRAAGIMPTSWLPHLISAGVFHEQAPAGAGRGKARMPRPLSAYLARCAKEFPGEVSSLILSCPASVVHGRPHLCRDFLRCAGSFDPKTTEKVATKALAEGWAGILTSYGLADALAAFVDRLFEHGKYCVGADLVHDGLRPAPALGAGSPKSDAVPRAATLGGHLFEGALTEVMNRIVRRNPEKAIEVLAHLLDAHAKQNPRAATHLQGCVASIDDSNQNGTGPINAIAAQLRDVLVRMGESSPDRLKKSMRILYRVQGTLSRRMEIYVYRRFAATFMKEATISLHMYFCRAEMHHEYYHLLKTAFQSLPEPTKMSLYALVDRTCGEYSKFERGAGPALEHLAHKKFAFMEAVHEHLDSAHAKEHAQLSKAFQASPHPDYLSYTEVKIGSVDQLPESLERRDWNDPDKVMKAVLSIKDTIGLSSADEGSIADKFESCVALDPDEYVQRSPMLRAAQPAIQYAFFAGVDSAIQKGRLAGLPDLTGLVAQIVEQAHRDPGHNSERIQWNLLLRICWLLETSFQKGVVGRDLGDALGKIIGMLAEIGARGGSSECPEREDVLLMGATNSVNGMSLILAFRYALWRGSQKIGGGGLWPGLRRIIDEYLDGGAAAHTSCRHSAIGLFIAAAHQQDPEWTRAVVGRILRTEAKAAFWSAYVAYNHLRPPMFEMLWTDYDIFLNGKLLYATNQHSAVDATFHHVALAHFYGLDHAGDIFERFLREAKPETVARTVMPLALIMEGKESDKDFDLEKASKLWKYEAFRKLDLGDWFRYSPLDKEASIKLYLDHLNQYEGSMDLLVGPVDKLESYADGFPVEVASCLLAMIKKSRMFNLHTIRQVVKRLDGNDNPRLIQLCSSIREALAERGFDLDNYQ